MAILYYPAGNFLGKRTTVDPAYEQIIISNNPDTVFYFGSASGVSAVTASMLLITSSYSRSASFAQQSFLAISASFASSASWTPGTVSSSYNYQTSSYTLQNSDINNEVVMNTPLFSILTIPSVLSSSFNCKIYQSGSGRIVFTGSGVTIRSTNNVYSSAGQGSTVNLYVGKSGEYILTGDLDDFNAQLVGWEDFSSLTPGYYTSSQIVYTSSSLWQSSGITGSFFVGSGSVFHVSSNTPATSQSINYVQFTSSNVYMGKMLNGNRYNVARLGFLGCLPGGITTGGVNSSMFLGIQTGTSSINQYITYIQNFTFFNASAPDACYRPDPTSGYNGGRSVNGSFSDSTPKALGGVPSPSYMGVPIHVSPRMGFMGMQFNKTTGSIWSVIAYLGYADIDYTYADLRMWLETGRMKNPFSRAVQPGVWTTNISESFGLLDTVTFSWATNPPSGTDANTKAMAFFAFGASNYIY